MKRYNLKPRSRWAGQVYVQQEEVCHLVAPVITSTRWQRLYAGYFGHSFFLQWDEVAMRHQPLCQWSENVHSSVRLYFKALKHYQCLSCLEVPFNDCDSLGFGFFLTIHLLPSNLPSFHPPNTPHPSPPYKVFRDPGIWPRCPPPSLPGRQPAERARGSLSSTRGRGTKRMQNREIFMMFACLNEFILQLRKSPLRFPPAWRLWIHLLKCHTVTTKKQK